ncbi:MAG: cytochrome P450 [Novosphingobium sp.]|nr:cytochrome P450 [Novosphingobium sp.]
MSKEALEKVERPAHVPQALVFEFDAFRPMQGEETYHEAYARWIERGVPELFWTPFNGGHWIAASRECLAEVASDYERFSSRFGASIDSPRTDADDETRPRLAPIEEDPPRQQEFRRLFAPAFTAIAVKQREDEVRTLAIELVGSLAPRGRCEFVTEFAQHLPIKIFMHMVDLPEEDRLTLIPLAQAQVAADAPKAEKMALLVEYVAKRVAERMQSPGDDLISRIVSSQIGGRPITFQEAIGVCSLLLIGGLDTVASMMGHIMHFLACSPPHRHALIADPTLVPGAVEEFLRRFALTNPARTVTRDLIFRGVTLKAGDKIMLATPFGAVDPRAYEDPLQVDFSRKSANKTTFGAGPHVCPGSMLARAEIRVLLEEWLKRIPDFELDPSDPPRVRTGVNGSMEHLPLIWQAG